MTEHARDVLGKRQIPLAWMERVLTAPELIEVDPIDQDPEHRLARIPELGNLVLRVIVNGKRTPPHVMTVFFDRRRTMP